MTVKQLASYLAALDCVLSEDATVSIEIDASDEDGPHWVVSDSVSIVVHASGNITIAGIRSPK